MKPTKKQIKDYKLLVKKGLDMSLEDFVSLDNIMMRIKNETAKFYRSNSDFTEFTQLSDKDSINICKKLNNINDK